MPERMVVRLLLVAEMEVPGEEPVQEAQDKLDAFREAARPSEEWGVTLHRVSPDGLGGFSRNGVEVLAAEGGRAGKQG
jgi:hypothetical protein